MARKCCVLLTLLSLVLLGTVVVLWTVALYFGVRQQDVITRDELDYFERLVRLAKDEQGKHVFEPPAAAVVVEPVDDVAAGTEPDVAGDVSALDIDAAFEGAEAAFEGARGDSREDDDDDDDERRALVKRGELTKSTAAAARPPTTPQPRIPRIIHQTWKSDTLPERWAKVREECAAMHPDYEYMLWTDADSRAFIAENYPWFLSAFDGYTYAIQRADAIRYFVLHHYGGIYMDLDIGCQRPMDALLYFQVILPQTIPVGISNDLMFAEKGHPFMDLVIHNLVTFNHQYGTNYPTVMFSTGPMFLSAQYGLWPKEDGLGAQKQVRVLPRRFYGKNAPADELPDSYFTHFYGSSWHTDDAGFITWLGKFGMMLMYLGVAVVVLGTVRLVWNKRPSGLRRAAANSLGGGARGSHGPIALPAEGLPFTRPGTPHDHHGNSQRGGVLYYLPVWIWPHGGASSSRYEPVPAYSRPPSPSNNSILHAPGTTDGAFDGMHLRSIMRTPQGSEDDGGSSSAPPPPYRDHPTPTSPSTSPKGWSLSFFRSGLKSAGFAPVVSSSSGGLNYASEPSSLASSPRQQHHFFGSSASAEHSRRNSGAYSDHSRAGTLDEPSGASSAAAPTHSRRPRARSPHPTAHHHSSSHQQQRRRGSSNHARLAGDVASGGGAGGAGALLDVVVVDDSFGAGHATEKPHARHPDPRPSTREGASSAWSSHEQQRGTSRRPSARSAAATAATDGLSPPSSPLVHQGRHAAGGPQHQHQQQQTQGRLNASSYGGSAIDDDEDDEHVEDEGGVVGEVDKLLEQMAPDTRRPHSS